MERRGDKTAHTRFAFAILYLVGSLVFLSLIIPELSVRADTLQTSITISICGNGLVDSGEVCDGGINNNTGGYGSTTAQRQCTPDCQAFGPYCGDGILQARFTEECDEGTANGGTGICSAICQSLPAVPPTTPPSVFGSIPQNPNANPGVIQANGKTQVVLKGKAYPNATINILLDGKAQATVRSDANANFLYTSDSMTPGTATFSFWAKDSDGETSLTTSAVFDIVQNAVTSVNNIFIPPTLSVSDRQITPGKLFTVFGQSVPTAKVVTAIDKDTSGALAATADTAGKWVLQLDTASLTTGFHTAKASFLVSSSTKSGFGKSVSFYIGSGLPKGGVSPDMNSDGKVNLVDFSIFLLSWNTHDVKADFNEDGIVNLADFSIMLFGWTG